MAKNISKYVGKNASTPQTEQAKSSQVKNNAGGYVFKVSDLEQLRRFLILGSTGGTYYVSERKLTLDNAKNILEMFSDVQGGIKAIDEIVKVSDEGLAPKNDPALFALALAAACDNDMVRKYALDNLNKVARIGTHLFTFVTYVDDLRGWGKGLQKAIQRWYDGKGDGLAFQVCKYPQRRVEGCKPWSHRDLLRKVHMKPGSENMNIVFKYVTKGRDGFTDSEWNALKANDVLKYIWAHEEAKVVTKVSEIVPLIKKYGLVRESIPNQLFGKEVFEALLEKMPMTAMIRNLNRMTECGLLVPLNEHVATVVERLNDEALLEKARIHPFNVLTAMRQYECGESRNLTWKPIPAVVDALEDAFYKSFKFVEPTGKRFLLGLDVSGSMSSGINCGSNWYGAPAGTLSCCEAATAMAMVTARTEKNSHIMGFSTTFKDLGIRAKDTLKEALRKTSNQNFGGTDCSLPMQWALKNKVPVDVFIVYTDNETWAGNEHPFEALKKYRKQMGIDAKLIVTAFAGTEFSIADPSDKGMLDVVGMDSSVPDIIRNFANGSI